MDAEGLILKQEILSVENTRQDYTVIAKKWLKDEKGQNYSEEYEKTKSEILSKVMMRFTWIDCETGEKDENLFGANGQNDWEKGLGSALTYGERYFLLKYFHIATDEDDIDNPDRKPEEKEPIKTVNHSKTELPYLEVDSKAWNGALSKKSELSSLRKYFRVSKENAEKYEKELINSMTEIMTVNITIEGLTDEQSFHLDKMLRKHYEVKDYKVLPDTSKLYDNDPVFRKILKGIKDSQLVKDRYINENRDKL